MSEKPLAPENRDVTEGEKAVNFDKLYDTIQASLAKSGREVSPPATPMNVHRTNDKPSK
jgi:hypothetical protein